MYNQWLPKKLGFYKQNKLLWGRKVGRFLLGFLLSECFSCCLKLVTIVKHLIWFFLQVEQSKVLIKEGGVQLLLTIVDTPGFGDAVDNSNW